MQRQRLLWTARVKEGLSFPKEFWNRRDFEDKKHTVYGPKTQDLQKHFIQCKQNLQCLLFSFSFFLFFRRGIQENLQCHIRIIIIVKIRITWRPHSFCIPWPSSSLLRLSPVTQIFFLHYEARSYKELATSNVNIVINIVFGKWNLYYHGNFKMMVFFQTHHLKTITYNLDKSFCN